MPVSKQSHEVQCRALPQGPFLRILDRVYQPRTEQIYSHFPTFKF